jgi:hypothetical protein
MKGGLALTMTLSFERDYSRLSVDVQKEVDECIEEFARDPLPPGRRPHSVTPRGQKPTIFSMDVTSNKAYKLSFHLENGGAVLRRVGTHGQIDRTP